MAVFHHPTTHINVIDSDFCDVTTVVIKPFAGYRDLFREGQFFQSRSRYRAVLLAAFRRIDAVNPDS
jgi:hypothetical protein